MGHVPVLPLTKLPWFILTLTRCSISTVGTSSRATRPELMKLLRLAAPQLSPVTVFTPSSETGTTSSPFRAFPQVRCNPLPPCSLGLEASTPSTCWRFPNTHISFPRSYRLISQEQCPEACACHLRLTTCLLLQQFVLEPAP